MRFETITNYARLVGGASRITTTPYAPTTCRASRHYPAYANNVIINKLRARRHEFRTRFRRFVRRRFYVFFFVFFLLSSPPRNNVVKPFKQSSRPPRCVMACSFCYDLYTTSVPACFLAERNSDGIDIYVYALCPVDGDRHEPGG